MFPVLLLSLIAAEPAATVAAVQDAPVRISINNDRRFVRGDRARVKVRVEDDGFLLVLQADAEGRIRVLFPLDPDDDSFVRGDRSYEIRGRGDRESFTVDEGSGEGAVYAAVSRDPFRFGEYAVNAHWDFNALNVRELPEDPEPELTELVRRMSSGRFEYDYLTYTVFDYSDVAYSPTVIHRTSYVDPFCGNSYYFRYDCDPYYYGGSRYSLLINVGSPYDYYDPYYYRYRSYYPYRYGYYYGRPYYDPYRYAGRPSYGYPYSPFPYRNRVISPSGFKQRDRQWDGDSYRDRVGGGGAGNIQATHTVYGEPPVRRAVTTSDPGRSPVASPSTSRDLSDRPSRSKAASPEPRRAKSTDPKPNVERAPVSRERVRTESEPGRREKDEPARVEPSRAEPRSAPPRASARPEPSRAAPSRAEPSRPAPSRAEPSRAAPARAEPSRSAPSRSESAPSRPSSGGGGGGGGGRRGTGR